MRGGDERSIALLAPVAFCILFVFYVFNYLCKCFYPFSTSDWPLLDEGGYEIILRHAVDTGNVSPVIIVTIFSALLHAVVVCQEAVTMSLK